MADFRSGPSRGRWVVTPCISTILADDFLRDLNSPVARNIRRSLKGSDFASVIGASIDPRSYSCPDAFWRDWQAVNLLSKYPEFPLGINTAEVALEKFKKAETVCAATNHRFKRCFETGPLDLISSASLIWEARQKIARLLGDFSWDKAEPYMSFSSGASTRLTKRNGDAYYKLQGIPEVTRNCAILALCAIERVPRWSARIREEVGLDPCKWVKIVPGNSITTVPKNAKTDRVIAKEPCMNMFIQKGIGGLLRSRLKRVGIDLDSQQLNQDLARVGSLYDSLVTLDLSAASDTIALELVRELLPPSWMAAIELCRSECGVLPTGELITYQKVSSMGNGFTFELESLIFWALSSAVVDLIPSKDGRQLAVYGDDIIVPKAASGVLVDLLEYCGFAINTEKSFENGPFRESCGKHYFLGVDVTPFYVKKPIDHMSRIFWYCNSLRRWASRPTPGYCDPRFKGTWDRALTHLPSRWRKPTIPDGIGDTGIIGSFAECTPRYSRGMSRVRCWEFSTGVRKRIHDEYTFLRTLMRREDPDPTALVVNRDKRACRVVTYSTSQWTDAPLWL